MFTSIGFDPLFSVIGLCLAAAGILIMARIWVSKRRLSHWKHVKGSKDFKYGK
ncbi:MAG: hypothetical protein PHN32_03040 [Actinomycetota bacterium]|nr:hypothetical protein [Actinomycetota bacterium]